MELGEGQALKVCNINGCKKNHYLLLHESTRAREPDVGNHVMPREGVTNPRTLTSRHNEKSLTEILSLRTVAVWLKANHRKVKVNAILDDASNETFLNEEVVCRSTSHSRAFRDCQSACFRQRSCHFSVNAGKCYH